MAQTHDFGRLYVSSLRYLAKEQSRFFVEVGWTNEVEEPYRRGHCLVFRIPFSTRAAVIGLWGRPGEEQDRLSSAVGLTDYGPLSDDTRSLFGPPETEEARASASSASGIYSF